jgi:membrane-associated protease RseP (regulator of RpoE activity)
VRLVRIDFADLSLFEFDYDLTWFVFFLGADETIYGRYGGRDAKGPDERNSLAGLRYAMTAAADAHRTRSNEAPPKRTSKKIHDYPEAKSYGASCIHCHQVNEIMRAQAKKDGTWKRSQLWVYPLPDNLGIILAKDQGDLAAKIHDGSPAAKAGIKAGDRIERIGETAIHSFADAQHALHHAPLVGDLPIRWQRGGVSMKGDLVLAEGWKKTNLTWRPSLFDILPSFPLFGNDLNAKEKQSLGLAANRLAFRHARKLPAAAVQAGMQEGDVIVGIDGQTMEMSSDDFLAHIRRNYLVNDRVTINVLREGKRVDLPWTLR